MKRYKLLQSVVLITLLSTASQANNDGFYVGVDASMISLGDDSLKITNKDKSTKTYNDVESSHANIKVGYQHFKNNRVELYYRCNTLDTNAGEIKTKTIGINYEWAFSSLSTEKLTPYVLIGIGGGETKSSKLKELDKAEVGEATFGLGVHYHFNENIDLQVGYNHISKGFDAFDNKTTDETSTIDSDSITLGVAYKF
jgi:opacity protein-like surface antigen